MPRRRQADALTSQLTSAMQQLLGQSFGRFCPAEAWAPTVNIYQLADRLVVCADLAGVDRDRIEVRVEPGALEIRGERPAPAPGSTGDAERPQRILAMEIDDGAFCRVIRIPEAVRLDEVESTYHQGLLWVSLPLDEPR
jgi:HSP20 family protein